MMRLVAVLMIVGSSCASNGTPFESPRRPDAGVVQTRVGLGTVRCDDLSQLEDAARVARLIDETSVRAGAKLGHLREDAVEVWLVPDWPVVGGPPSAVTFERCIVFDPTEEAMELVDWILVHEFVHWHSEGSVLQDHLPHAIMEGLCELIATEISPRWRAEQRAMYDGYLRAAREAGELPTLISRLGLSLREWMRLPPREQRELTALGFQIARRLGVEELRSKAELGNCSPEAILELAGIRRDGTGLLLEAGLSPSPPNLK